MAALHLRSVAVALRAVPALAGSPHVIDLVNGFVDCSAFWTVGKAAHHGHLHLLQHLGEAQASHQLPRHQLASVAGIAAKRGHVPILEWVHSLPYRGAAFTANLMNTAAKNGHLHVVQWLHTHRTEGCSAQAMDGAAGNGHLSVVQFLHENRSEGCTTDAMDNAAANGHLDVVKFLHDHRTEGCSKQALERAISKRKPAILRYLRRHCADGCSFQAISNAVSASLDQHNPQVGVEMLQMLYESFPVAFSPVCLFTCARFGGPLVGQWVVRCVLEQQNGNAPEGGEWVVCLVEEEDDD